MKEMKLRVFGAIVILAALGLWGYTFVLADRWMEYLRTINDDPYGYYEISMLPLAVPLLLVLLCGLWLLAPIVGRGLVDWLSR